MPTNSRSDFDAIVPAAGAEVPRDLPIPGRELKGIYAALEFLIPQNKEVSGGPANPINVKGKHVVVIGGGDTGSRLRRHLESPWRLRHPVRTDVHAPGAGKQIADLALLALSCGHPHPMRKAVPAISRWPPRPSSTTARATSRRSRPSASSGSGGKMTEVAGSNSNCPVMPPSWPWFYQPEASLLEAFGVEKDARGNARATTDGDGCYATSVPKVFAAGDVRRGQSLVVWAIREGRQAAREVDLF